VEEHSVLVYRIFQESDLTVIEAGVEPVALVYVALVYPQTELGPS